MRVAGKGVVKIFNSKITQIDHIGIAVRDMEETIKNYEQLFDLKVAHLEINEEFKVKICFIPLGEVLVEFLEPTEKGSPFDLFIEANGESVHHIAYRVNNIDAALEDLKGKGVKLQHEKARPGGAGSRIAFLEPGETNGIAVELVERSNKNF